ERREIAGAGWAFALEALIAFNALVGRITGFAFLENDLHPVYAAVALVDESPVVGDAIGEGNAVWRIWAGPVDERRQELLVLCLCRHGQSQAGKRRGGCQSPTLASHSSHPPWFGPGKPGTSRAGFVFSSGCDLPLRPAGLPSLLAALVGERPESQLLLRN